MVYGAERDGCIVKPEPAPRQFWAPVVGKYGRTRDGRKVGPMFCLHSHVTSCWEGWVDDSAGPFRFGWTADGRAGVELSDLDLVSEWVDDLAPVQPIDLSKIMVGDKVRLGGEFEVQSVHLGTTWPVRVKAPIQGLGELGICREMVEAHIPVFRPVEVGCHVTGDGLPCCNPHKVLAIVDGQAWVKAGDHSQAIVPVAGLTRCGGGAA